MTDEEHYNAMAESMMQDDITVVSGTGTEEDPLILGGSAIDDLAIALDLAAEQDAETNPALDVDLPKAETPREVAQRIAKKYIKMFGNP